MRKLLALSARLLLAFAIAPATFAATDVTGIWTTQVQTPEGNVAIVVHFKQDGERLTGKIEPSGGGDTLEISNGKVQGDKLSFSASLNGMTLSQVGTVSGDEIKLTASSDSGAFPPVEVTLKRAPTYGKQ